jgi:nucleoside-diphosphate-sugar epimerase
MADTVLLTGVSGFLGGHVAVALLNAGYRVRGSVRSPGRAESARQSIAKATASGNADGLEFVELDLLDDRGWREAAQGCRYVQHVASPFPIVMPEDKDELIRPAVEGTRRALEAALAAGAERVVLTSSSAAVVYGHPLDRVEPFTDADWSRTSGADVTHYTESKTLAELEAWSVMEAAGRRQDLVTINPQVILGPLLSGDASASIGLVKRLLDGSVPVAARFYVGIVDVRDVAALHLAAMEAPEAGGHRFLAAAGIISLLEAAQTLRPVFPEYAGKMPCLQLPDWLVRLFAFADKETQSNISSLGVRRIVDARPAQALLGRPFMTPHLALLASARSLIDHRIV